MIADGATEFYEVGAGTVLMGLLRRIDRGMQARAIGTFEALDALKSD